MKHTLFCIFVFPAGCNHKSERANKITYTANIVLAFLQLFFTFIVNLIVCLFSCVTFCTYRIAIRTREGLALVDIDIEDKKDSDVESITTTASMNDTGPITEEVCSLIS